MRSSKAVSFSIPGGERCFRSDLKEKEQARVLKKEQPALRVNDQTLASKEVSKQKGMGAGGGGNLQSSKNFRTPRKKDLKSRNPSAQLYEKK